jgi:hypothetical protein
VAAPSLKRRTFDKGPARRLKGVRLKQKVGRAGVGHDASLQQVPGWCGREIVLFSTGVAATLLGFGQNDQTFKGNLQASLGAVLILADQLSGASYLPLRLNRGLAFAVVDWDSIQMRLTYQDAEDYHPDWPSFLPPRQRRLVSRGCSFCRVVVRTLEGGVWGLKRFSPVSVPSGNNRLD